MAVIVLLADGLRVDTLRDALDAGSLPALAALREEGGLHELTTVFPSVTGPAYVPFLLGRFPGSVGIPGLRWFDRSRRACTFPDYTRSYVGYQMGAVNRDIDRASPTVFELVPGSAGALSMITRGLPPDRQLMTLSPASALRAIRTHFTGDLEAWMDVDRETSARVIDAARAGRTPYLFAAFMGIDKLSHARGQQPGGGMTLSALRILDDTVAAVRGRGSPQPRVWVASDHGHSSVTNHDDLHRAISDRGHRTIAHPWVYAPRPDVALMVSGNAMAHIYVELAHRTRPFWPALEQRWTAFAEWLLARESVDLMLVPLDASRCAVWSRARGRATVTACGRRYSYDCGDGDPLGVGAALHAISADAAHEATRDTDYPDAIVQIAAIGAAQRAGDFILSARRGWDFRERYEPIPHVSSHGALHRDHMVVPLLLDRPPSRQPLRTVDVMPSALAALGFTPPAALDGISCYRTQDSRS